MSRLLLDSHVVLWLLEDDDALGVRARTLILDADAVFMSAASAWELGLKASLGKLELSEDFGAAVADAGLRELPVTLAHGLECDMTALPHADPFDALLVAQARAEHLGLVTADAKILQAWPDAIDARR